MTSLLLFFLLPAGRYNDTGAAEFRAGHYAAAAASFRQALALETHPAARARIASNLAATARRLEDWPAAEHWSRLVVDLRRDALGEHHADTVIALHNLGDLLAARGRRPEALPYLEEALRHVRRHDDRATILATLARVQQEQGALKSALASAEALVEQVRRDLALRALAQGRVEEARGHCRSTACRAWVDSLVR